MLDGSWSEVWPFFFGFFRSHLGDPNLNQGSPEQNCALCALRGADPMVSGEPWYKTSGFVHKTGDVQMGRFRLTHGGLCLEFPGGMLKFIIHEQVLTCFNCWPTYHYFSHRSQHFWFGSSATTSRDLLQSALRIIPFPTIPFLILEAGVWRRNGKKEIIKFWNPQKLVPFQIFSNIDLRKI